jgi:hypothetical protein
VSVEDDVSPPPSFDETVGASLVPPVADASVDDEDEADLARVALVDERSFFAQPEPLKCTAGVVIALVIVPSAPQAGQNRGPAALMPWITSMRCLQFPQM